LVLALLWLGQKISVTFRVFRGFDFVLLLVHVRWPVRATRKIVVAKTEAAIRIPPRTVAGGSSVDAALCYSHPWFYKLSF
jgi:hypothetical protein